MTRNPSYTRTDKAIIKAFIDLLKEKPLEKITVQNILDKTPVTRATFYAHFCDKYEIAEKMQASFLEFTDSIREQLKNKTPAQYKYFIEKSFVTHHDLIEALLKIHTDKVDIHEALAKKFEYYYVNALNPNASLTEARIYGLIRAELNLSVIYDKTIISSPENYNEFALSLTLNLLRLSDDEEVWNFLRQKLNKKFNL